MPTVATVVRFHLLLITCAFAAVHAASASEDVAMILHTVIQMEKIHTMSTENRLLINCRTSFHTNLFMETNSLNETLIISSFHVTVN